MYEKFVDLFRGEVESVEPSLHHWIVANEGCATIERPLRCRVLLTDPRLNLIEKTERGELFAELVCRHTLRNLW